MPDLDFAWPWLALILPLPWLLRRALAPARRTGDSLWLPVLGDYQAAAAGSSDRPPRWPAVLASIAWALLVLASMRPALIAPPSGLPVSGRNLLLAVDLSESMSQTDFRLGDRFVTRLAATKKVARDFISQRTGDRVGLIVFGTQAYVQAPLTLDLETVQILLSETAIGLAGGKTAIGDTIGLAIKRVRASRARQRVLILMTDGANTAGRLEPLTAARLAVANGLRIYTIGIGRSPGGSERRDGQNGRVGGGGADDATLERVARATHGRSFRAENTASLARIYAEIDALEPVITAEPLAVRTSLYPWPLAGALCLLVASLIPVSRRQAT